MVYDWQANETHNSNIEHCCLVAVSTHDQVSSLFMLVFSRVTYHVLIVLHIIYGYRSTCLCVPKDKYHVLIVQHMINEHHCSCLCLPELHTVFLLFDISMTFLLYVCVFQNSIMCPYCLIFLLSLSLFMIVSSRDKYHVLSIRHIIYNHHRLCLCPAKINTVPVMFGISSMIIVVCVYVFHNFVPYNIVRHIIHDPPSLCLCFPGLNIVPYCSTHDLWSSLLMFVP